MGDSIHLGRDTISSNASKPELPSLEAKRYESRLERGNVLVSVHLENPEQAQRVKDVFCRARSPFLCSTRLEST